MKSKIQDLTKKYTAIEKLESSGTTWAEVLNELSNVVSENVWLSRISYDREKENTKKSKGKEITPAENLNSGIPGTLLPES